MQWAQCDRLGLEERRHYSIGHCNARGTGLAIREGQDVVIEIRLSLSEVY